MLIKINVYIYEICKHIHGRIYCICTVFVIATHKGTLWQYFKTSLHIIMRETAGY